MDHLLKLSKGVIRAVKLAAKTPGSFFVGEETLTEMLLLRFKARNGTYVVQKPTRQQESIEGHDWVWTIKTHHGYGTMKVQAKKLYKNGKYTQLNHHYVLPSGDYELQLERLIRSAQSRNQAPIYALYNGPFGVFSAQHVDLSGCCRKRLQNTNRSNSDYSPLGVTMVDAHWIQHLMPPNPSNVSPVPPTHKINENAIPWECLTQCVHLPGAGPPDPNWPGGGPDDPDSPSGEPFEAASEKDDSSDRPDGSGVYAHPQSYLRKLARALQTGERSPMTSGFSREEPEWLQTFTNIRKQFDEVEDIEETVRLYRSLESLEVDELPRFYVFTDLSEGDFLSENLSRALRGN